MTAIKAFATEVPKGILQPFEYDPGSLKPDNIEVQVEYCGICHSDLSMLNNDWMMTQYPFVPGHEIVGKIVAMGDAVTHLEMGQRVGIGWTSGSCLVCDQCMTGNHNLCPEAEGVIVGRFGGFADRVRAQAAWAVPVPDQMDPKVAGPMFCGGITVFNPIVQYGVSPLDHVAVVGIGGLGHMALGFLDAWGCEVTAFSSTPSKEEEVRKMGADHFVNSRDSEAIKSCRGKFDMVLVTVNVGLDWQAYLSTLKPKGKLHFVGAAPDVTAPVFTLIGGQKSISGSPLGSPATTASMMEFAARHKISPVVETFPMSEVNEAIEHLKAGKARYRIVLEAGK